MVKGVATFPSSQRRGGAAAARLTRRGGQFGRTVESRPSIEASPYRARASRPPLRGGE